MKRLPIIVLSLGLAIGVKAQSELTLPFMKDVFQSSYINPTILPEHTVSVGLPGMSSIYFQVITNGFIPKNIIETRNNKTYLIPDKLLSELSDKNLIYTGASVDLFHLRMKIRNGYYWVGIRTNINQQFQFPKELFEFPIKGNAQYIGSTLDFSNFRVDATLYNEYSFGMAKDFNRWTFGGRISVLQGIANIQLDPKSFNIQIDSSMYAHTFNADVTLNTAGVPKDNSGDPSFDRFNETSYLTNYLTSFKNKGYSLSAGVTYKLDDKTRFSFSFSDLGFINWKDNVTNYTLKGKSSFSGLDFLTSFLNNEDIKADTVFDSMVDDFTRDTIQKSYRTYLHPKFYASASYDIFSRTNVGLSFSSVYNKKLYPAVTLGLQQGIGRFFNLLGTISYNQKTIRNLGVGFMIKPGPLQIFIVADNIYPAINPLYTTNVNFRFGMNYVFGRVKQAAGLPYR